MFCPKCEGLSRMSCVRYLQYWSDQYTLPCFHRHGVIKADPYSGAGRFFFLLLLNTVIKSNISKWFRLKISWRLQQCRGSGMFIPDPRSWFLSIPDPGSKNSTQRLKEIFFVLPFFVATNIMKIVNNFIFEQVKKFCKAKTLRIIILFYPNICQ